MVDNIRNLMDSDQMAEYKKFTDAKLKAYNRGYDKGFMNGNLTGFVVAVGLYMLVQLAGKVL